MAVKVKWQHFCIKKAENETWPEKTYCQPDSSMVNVMENPDTRWSWRIKLTTIIDKIEERYRWRRILRLPRSTTRRRYRYSVKAIFRSVSAQPPEVSCHRGQGHGRNFSPQSVHGDWLFLWARCETRRNPPSVWLGQVLIACDVQKFRPRWKHMIWETHRHRMWHADRYIINVEIKQCQHTVLQDTTSRGKKRGTALPTLILKVRSFKYN